MTSFVKAPKQGLMMDGRVVRQSEPPVKPKRYLVFAGENYYPGGGWSDFIGSADTEADAIEAANACKADWSHIVDIETGQEL